MNENARTKLPDLSTHRHLKLINIQQLRASQRLSSGLRINSVIDDATGLTVSEKMRAQARGLDQAFRNAQDGISLVQTVEEGVACINETILRMRELVIKDSSDTNTHSNGNLKQSNRERIQCEINQIIDEIDIISFRTQFNTMPLLNGKYARPASLPPALSNAIMELDTGNITSPCLHSSSVADYFINIQTLTSGDSGAGWSFDGTILAVNNSANIEITGAVANGRRIEVDGTARIILRDVSITGLYANQSAISLNNGANLVLNIEGINTLASGLNATEICVAEGISLSINGVGSLSIAGGTMATSIGSGYRIRQTNEGNIAMRERARVLGFQIGANSGLGVIFHIETMNAYTLGFRDGNNILIDILEKSNANILQVLNVLDTALAHTAQEQARLAAMQNRLKHIVNSLEISKNDLSISESRIRDSDMARKMIRFVRANTRLQVASFMLAQANQIPFRVLQLLAGAGYNSARPKLVVCTDSVIASKEYPNSYILMTVDDTLEYGITYGKVLHVAKTMEELDDYVDMHSEFQQKQLHYVSGANIVEKSWENYYS